MMTVSNPISSQLRALEANESGNVIILSLINVIAGHDDFLSGRVSNQPMK